jgi:hypothetical protein
MRPREMISCETEGGLPACLDASSWFSLKGWKAMVAPDCQRCGKAIGDWQANVMVDMNAYLNGRIEGLHLICKNCIRRMDGNREADRLHSIWELAAVKKSPWAYFARIVEELMSTSPYSKKWALESVREFGLIVALTLPYDEATHFVRSLNPDEWDYPGQYWKVINYKHGKSD